MSAFVDRPGQIDFCCKIVQSLFKFKIRFTAIRVLPASVQRSDRN